MKYLALIRRYGKDYGEELSSKFQLFNSHKTLMTFGKNQNIDEMDDLEDMKNCEELENATFYSYNKRGHNEYDIYCINDKFKKTDDLQYLFDNLWKLHGC